MLWKVDFNAAIWSPLTKEGFEQQCNNKFFLDIPFIFLEIPVLMFYFKNEIFIQF